MFCEAVKDKIPIYKNCSMRVDAVTNNIISGNNILI